MTMRFHFFVTFVSFAVQYIIVESIQRLTIGGGSMTETALPVFVFSSRIEMPRRDQTNTSF